MTDLTQKRLDYHVPAREGKAFRVSEGELVKIIDLRVGRPWTCLPSTWRT